MQRREKIIAASIAGVAALYLGGKLLDSTFLAPLNQRDAQIEGLLAQQDGKLREKRQLTQAMTALADARRISLPKDRYDAQRLYMEWITELAQSCGLTDFVVPANQGQPSQAQKQAFVEIPFTFTAKATYDQAVQFLERFSEVDLLQRVATFDVKAPSQELPLLLTVKVEGLVMPDASDRATLFPETALTAELTADQTQLSALGSADFPKQAPFRIKVGREWIDVTAANGGVWTVQRGAAGSAAQAHNTGETVELVPLRKAKASDRSAEALAALMATRNLFAKPRPKVEIKPRLSPSGTQPAVKGTPLTLTVKADIWDQSAGVPTFEIEGETLPGLTLDAETGALKWTPPPETAPGEYKVKIAAYGALAPSTRAVTELTFKLRNANRPPKFKSAGSLNAFLGRPFSLEAIAEDPDENERLRYELTGTPLAGAAIDARSGKFTWTPGEDLEPGDFRQEVTVTDGGEPPLTAKTTLVIKASEDSARFAKLSGIVGLNGTMQAWFTDPSVNKKTVLHEGESFRFSEIEGKVVAIDKDSVTFETAGNRMRLVIGDAVREMKPAPPPPEKTEPAEAPVVEPEKPKESTTG